MNKSPDKILVGDHICDDPVGIANAFNDHFTSCPIANTPNNLNYCFNASNFNYLKKCESTFYLNPVRLSSVERSIDKLKNKVSEASDGLSNKFVKLCKNELAPVLLYFINFLFMSSIFPNCLKNVRVVPLFKKGDKLLLGNYRPLSIISPISKVIENIVAFQIHKYLRINRLLYPYQFGFREKMSTELAILKCQEFLSENKANVSAVIAVDLSRAFDAVRHDILRHKLKMLGFSKEALQWIDSYLKHRTQYVEISKGRVISKSQLKEVLFGVPQGSILGPLLFILFINDLVRYLKIKLPRNYIFSLFKIVLYADDVLLIISNKLFEKLEVDAYILLNLLNQWCILNCIDINKMKTQFLLMNLKPNLKFEFNILLDDVFVERVMVLRYLGMELDEKANFQMHVSKVCKKLNSALFIIKHLSKFSDRELLLLVYHTLFISHINYCLACWSDCNLNLIEKVFRIQKRAIRVIFKIEPRESCKETFMINNLLTVPALIILSKVKHFNSARKKLPQLKDRHSHDTRGKEYYIINQENVGLKLGYEYFKKLPEDIRKTADMSRLFKIGVKNYLIKKCPYKTSQFLEM